LHHLSEVGVHREDKLERLLKIINLQLDLEWDEFLRDDKRNIFYYFHSLGLISRETLDAIYARKARLRVNRPFRSFCAHLDYHFSPHYYSEETVIDVGAGWGAITFWLLLSGARVVFAIGDPVRTPFVTRLYEEALARGLLPEAKEVVSVPRLIRPGQVRFGPEIRDGGAALVLFHDVFEHISPRALPSALAASYAALRTGGRLVSKCHNSDAPGFVARLRPHWEAQEQEYLIPQRLRRIRDLLPGVDPGKAKEFAQRTRGLDAEGFQAAVALYRQKGAMPAVTPDLAPIDIDQNIVEEGYIRPAQVCQQMRTAGFEVLAYPAMMTSRRSRYLQPFARVFPSVFWRLHWFDESVVFVGRKRARTQRAASAPH
jgi:hypothetical protein